LVIFFFIKHKEPNFDASNKTTKKYSVLSLILIFIITIVIIPEGLLIKLLDYIVLFISEVSTMWLHFRMRSFNFELANFATSKVLYNKKTIVEQTLCYTFGCEPSPSCTTEQREYLYRHIVLEGNLIIAFLIIGVLITKLKNTKYPEGSFWKHIRSPQGWLTKLFDFFTYPLHTILSIWRESRKRFNVEDEQSQGSSAPNEVVVKPISEEPVSENQSKGPSAPNEVVKPLSEKPVSKIASLLKKINLE